MKCLIFLSDTSLLEEKGVIPYLNYIVSGVLENVPIYLLVDKDCFSDYYFWKWASYPNKGISTLVSPDFNFFTEKLQYWVEKLEIRENLFLISTTRCIDPGQIRDFILEFKKIDKLLFSKDLSLVLLSRQSLRFIVEELSSKSNLEELLYLLVSRFTYSTFSLE